MMYKDIKCIQSINQVGVWEVEGKYTQNQQLIYYTVVSELA